MPRPPAAAADAGPAGPEATPAAFLAAVLDTAAALVVVLDAAGRIVRFNRACEVTTGYAAAEVAGRPFWDLLLVPEEAPAVRAAFAELLAAGGDFPAASEHHWRTRDGRRRLVAWSYAALADEHGESRYAVATGVDVTRTCRLEEERRGAEADRRFRQAFEHSPMGMAVLSAEPGRLGRFEAANPALAATTGYEAEELAGRTALELTHPDDAAGEAEALAELARGERATHVREKRLRHARGHEVWVCAATSAITDDAGRTLHLVEHVEDVTARKRAEAELVRRALYDSLTGLPNRQLLADRLRHAAAGAARTGLALAVLFLDLDRFKVVNDSLGHAVGDELLRHVARVLEGAVRPGDTVARLGGDEFVVLCEGAAGPQEATAIAGRLEEALAAPFASPGGPLSITASVGVALAGPGGVDPEAVLRDADAAMYRAKERGKARHELFDDALRECALRRLGAEVDLRRAIDEDRLVLRYQPVVDLASGGVVGVEALVRYEDRAGGLVEPAAFLDVAEESGLVVPLGRWVLAEACRQLGAWRAEHPVAAPLTLAVNLAAAQLAQPDLVEEVDAAVAASGLRPEELCLEITETALVGAAHSTMANLERLRARGVRLALDDFGTGYSSLTYLKRFPVGVLKVDRSFVDGLGSDPDDTAIVDAVVGLGRSLGLTVVAEGVETAQQEAHLKDLGCDLVQGYYYARPLPAEAVAALLELEGGQGG